MHVSCCELAQLMLVKLANHNKSMIAQLPHLNEYSVGHRAVACPADAEQTTYRKDVMTRLFRLR